MRVILFGLLSAMVAQAAVETRYECSGDNNVPPNTRLDPSRWLPELMDTGTVMPTPAIDPDRIMVEITMTRETDGQMKTGAVTFQTTGSLPLKSASPFQFKKIPAGNPFNGPDVFASINENRVLARGFALGYPTPGSSEVGFELQATVDTKDPAIVLQSGPQFLRVHLGTVGYANGTASSQLAASLPPHLDFVVRECHVASH